VTGIRGSSSAQRERCPPAPPAATAGTAPHCATTPEAVRDEVEVEVEVEVEIERVRDEEEV
jgi:hypothetical protein